MANKNKTLIANEQDQVPALEQELERELNIPASEEDLTEAMDAEMADAPVEVDTQAVEEPSGHRVPTDTQKKNRKRKEEKVAETKPEPALSAAPRRSSQERKEDKEEYLSSRNMRQEDAVTVGKYISAQRRNNVLSGRIAGVEVRGTNALWVIYDGPVVIMIPFQDALPFLTSKDFEAVKSDLNRQRQLLAKSVGAEVSFSVEQIEPDLENNVYLVYGSRKVALQRIRKRYFGKNATNPVQVGDTVTGTFLAVGPHAAWINVRGADIRMIPRQLSHRYMEDMSTVYKPGDEVELRVQRMEMKDDMPQLTVSALPCELEQCKTRLGRVRKGNRYHATITSHRVINTVNPKTKKSEPYYVAYMWLEGVEVAAFATMTSSHAKGTAHSGDRVLVQVEQVADNGYVRCRIVSYLPN